MARRGSVQALNTSSRGASNTRVMTSSRSAGLTIGVDLEATLVASPDQRRKGISARPADVVIGTDAKTWLRLRTGELSAVEAFRARTLYARGALDDAVRSNLVKPGQTLLLEGVGGGFTWGAVLLDF